MQKQYGKDGLVCLSVNVDDADAKGDALKFLKAKQATFVNYWLDEESEVWQEKWKFKGPPAAFVFDREGRRAAKFDTDTSKPQYNVEEVEKLVKKLLYP